MSNATIVKDEKSLRYRIEVYRTCCSADCAQHPERGWYEAKGFRGILADPNTSLDYAETLMQRMQQESPRSRYRLVEVETVHRIVETVVAQ